MDCFLLNSLPKILRICSAKSISRILEHFDQKLSLPFGPGCKVKTSKSSVKPRVYGFLLFYFIFIFFCFFVRMFRMPNFIGPASGFLGTHPSSVINLPHSVSEGIKACILAYGWMHCFR